MDLEPAPPRWEGSWRISCVVDLCYLLRRTIQACYFLVNSAKRHDVQQRTMSFPLCSRTLWLVQEIF